MGTPVYDSAYVGKFFPYATPAQYGYPMCIGGTLATWTTYTRYSDATRTMPYSGNKATFQILFVDGTYINPFTYPYTIIYSANLRDHDGIYHLRKVELFSRTQGFFGELDGIYHITGFNNVVENTLKINGVDYVVIQDINRTTFGSYFAMELK